MAWSFSVPENILSSANCSRCLLWLFFVFPSPICASSLEPLLLPNCNCKHTLVVVSRWLSRYRIIEELPLRDNYSIGQSCISGPVSGTGTSPGLRT